MTPTTQLSKVSNIKGLRPYYRVNYILTPTEKDAYDDTEDELGRTHYKLVCDCKGYQYKSTCYHIRDVREFISSNPQVKTILFGS